MGTIAKPITFEESLLLPEDKCEEIIRGVSRRMPPASYNHADTARRVFLAFFTRLHPRIWKVEAFGAGQLIHREPLTYRIPDVAVYKTQGFRAEHYIISAPELIVEILSPANRKGDLDELLRHYLEIRVPEVWFVYLDRRELARLRLQSGGYVEAERTGEGSVEALGVTVSLDEIWAE